MSARCSWMPNYRNVFHWHDRQRFRLDSLAMIDRSVDRLVGWLIGRTDHDWPFLVEGDWWHGRFWCN